MIELHQEVETFEDNRGKIVSAGNQRNVPFLLSCLARWDFFSWVNWAVVLWRDCCHQKHFQSVQSWFSSQACDPLQGEERVIKINDKEVEPRGGWSRFFLSGGRFCSIACLSLVRGDPPWFGESPDFLQDFFIETFPNTNHAKNYQKTLMGAFLGNPPKCTVSHYANGPGWPLWQINFSLLIAQIWLLMTQNDWLWSGMTYHGSEGCQGV